MNAYELANNLENKDRLWAIDENLMLNICEMLRQQADRIAELEDRLSMYEIKDLDRGIIGRTKDYVIHDLVHRTTPQIKELSDEEIDLKWWISSFEHLKALGGGISNEMETKLKDMKERLKKASEK
jgi:hypothetical protein